MTYTIIWEPEATDTAARFLKEDPVGLAGVYDAVDSLADNPRPRSSVAYGGTYRRLRVGRYRVLYFINDDVIRIIVTHLGRTP